jgi:hypothetical protein
MMPETKRDINAPARARGMPRQCAFDDPADAGAAVQPASLFS